jgi:acid-sensing ion channel, other
MSFIVHSPYEPPGSYDAMDVFMFDYGSDLEVLITPEIIRTDEDVTSLDPNKRGCYFEGEKKLKYFKIYTRRNCEFECLADNLRNLANLNCTPYFMVRDSSMELCDYRQELMRKQLTFIAIRNLTKCGCLDECNLIKYRIEIVSHKLLNDSEVSIDFKFKEIDVVPLRRYQPLTFSNFLAQSGGMMGIFAGISVLSIIELFYFMTLRWMVNLWRWSRS